MGNDLAWVSSALEQRRIIHQQLVFIVTYGIWQNTFIPLTLALSRQGRGNLERTNLVQKFI
jgi:hypothetical protein